MFLLSNREIKILKKLNHQNVIKLIDVFDDPQKQKLYIVLEYCVGGLQEMLDKAPGNRFPVWQAHKYYQYI
jgi:serine/threonine-protein kinase 11